MSRSGRTEDGPRDGREVKSAKTRESLRQAAERIVQRHGVGSLTLERVAEEAGVSKGGLLYHFSTKQDLLATLLGDALADADARLNELAEPGGPGSFATAYLDYVRDGEHTGPAASGILAAAALDDGELGPAQAQFERWQNRLRHADGIDPDVALLARIVGDGLWLIDLFGLAPPSDGERQAVLNLVQSLIEAER